MKRILLILSLFSTFSVTAQYEGVIGVIASSASSSYDPDAEAYISAVGLTGSDATATNQMFLNLKAYGLYDKIYFGHFLCWNDATKNTYDFKLGTNIIWYGGLTHASGYVTTNGTTGFGSYGTNPANVPFLLDDHGATFNNYNASPSGLSISFGIGFGSAYNFNFSGGTFNAYIDDNTGASFSAPTKTGLFSANRINSTTVKGYRDGVYISSQSSTSTILPSTMDLTLFGYNSMVSSDLGQNMVFHHKAFNDQENSDMKYCVTTFLTALGY
jgi:hypothetical protein